MIICSDPQVHDFKEFAEPLKGELTTRLQEFIDSFRFIGNYAKESGETELLILGDIFEVKGYVKVLVYNLVFKEIARLKKEGINVRILTGNHDQYDSGGLIHSLVPFKELCTVYDVMKLDHIEGRTCVFLPYRKNKKDIYDAFMQIEKMDLPKDSILFMHQLLQGASINDMFYASTGGLVIPESIKSRFQWIIAGDVHNAQQFENIIYPGAVYSRNFGDAFDAKSFLHLKDGVLNKIANPCSPLFLKYTVKNEEDLDTMKLEHTARVYIDVEASKPMFDAVNELLSAQDNVRFRVRLIKEKVEAKKRTDIQLAMGAEDVIRKYVDYAGQGDQELKDLGIQIYREAIKKS